MKLLFENWRGYLNESKNVEVQKTPTGFTLKLFVDQPVGIYTHNRKGDNVRNTAEIFPEYRGKGYGTIMLLAAIKTAGDFGIEFKEDNVSLTPAMSRLYDELDEQRWIVRAGGSWAITDDGKEELQNWMKEEAGTAVWYHITDASRARSIEDGGLKVGQESCLTNESGKWALQYYGGCPVYLSQSPYITEEEAWEWGIKEIALFEVNVSGLNLMADLQGLVDARGQLDDDSIWWEDDDEPIALEGLLEDGETEILNFLDNDSYINAAIEITKTATVMQDIPAERIKRIQ